MFRGWWEIFDVISDMMIWWYVCTLHSVCMYVKYAFLTPYLPDLNDYYHYSNSAAVLLNLSHQTSIVNHQPSTIIHQSSLASELLWFSLGSGKWEMGNGAVDRARWLACNSATRHTTNFLVFPLLSYSPTLLLWWFPALRDPDRRWSKCSRSESGLRFLFPTHHIIHHSSFMIHGNNPHIKWWSRVGWGYFSFRLVKASVPRDCYDMMECRSVWSTKSIVRIVPIVSRVPRVPRVPRILYLGCLTRLVPAPVGPFLR